MTSKGKELVVAIGEHQEKKFLLCKHFLMFYYDSSDCEFGIKKRSYLSLIGRLKKLLVLRLRSLLVMRLLLMLRRRTLLKPRSRKSLKIR